MIVTPEGIIYPVDYKLAKQASKHYRLQLAAYAMLLESEYGREIESGFLNLLTSSKLIKVQLTSRLRNDVLRMLEALEMMVQSEVMPPPSTKVSYCYSCEFRRFCNDVL